ncbi:short integuments 2, mitochondrial-like [Gossypium australe]|uniref:Short integuments 2, mitochondrial-like n=1 Tax=Gossypium australe TaxID=47621 RepID=A0A5B6V810_9ROSI|nr:short integuments 2, mitochondrial-like [Gossypium australe]
MMISLKNYLDFPVFLYYFCYNHFHLFFPSHFLSFESFAIKVLCLPFLFMNSNFNILLRTYVLIYLVLTNLQIAHQPSIYVLDTPGVLVPNIPNIEIGLKLALAGSVKDSVVGEDRIVQYLLTVLNTRGTPLHWKHLANPIEETTQISEDKPDYNPKDLRPKMKKLPDASDLLYVKDLVAEVRHALYVTLSEFGGNIEDENDMECLVEHQFEVLQKVLRIPHKSSEARLMRV